MRYINKSRFFALFFLLTLLFTLILSYAKSISQNISDSVVRLHIIANSNSEIDQTIKLKVRDRILAETAEIFSKTANAAEALSVAKTNATLIKDIAENELHLHRFNDSVKVSVGEYAFPTKFYNDIALPAGRYNAVRIEIGKAVGENWWCVMYPPLCFTDGVLVSTDEAKEKLKNSLSASEYDLISQDYPSIEVKFKIVELFQKWF